MLRNGISYHFSFCKTKNIKIVYTIIAIASCVHDETMSFARESRRGAVHVSLSQRTVARECRYNTSGGRLLVALCIFGLIKHSLL